MIFSPAPTPATTSRSLRPLSWRWKKTVFSTRRRGPSGILPVQIASCPIATSKAHATSAGMKTPAATSAITAAMSWNRSACCSRAPRSTTLSPNCVIRNTSSSISPSSNRTSPISCAPANTTGGRRLSGSLSGRSTAMVSNRAPSRGTWTGASPCPSTAGMENASTSGLKP